MVTCAGAPETGLSSVPLSSEHRDKLCKQAGRQKQATQTDRQRTDRTVAVGRLTGRAGGRRLCRQGWALQTGTELQTGLGLPEHQEQAKQRDAARGHGEAVWAGKALHIGTGCATPGDGLPRRDGRTQQARVLLRTNGSAARDRPPASTGTACAETQSLPGEFRTGRQRSEACAHWKRL